MKEFQMKETRRAPRTTIPALAASRATRRKRIAKRGTGLAAAKPARASKVALDQIAASRGPETKHISFDWFFPNANQVCIAGSFNNWHPSGTPLKNCGHGRWLLDLALAPGRYPFRFIVDGQWADEPGVTSRFLFVN
jgi:hypothetical protein